MKIVRKENGNVLLTDNIGNTIKRLPEYAVLELKSDREGEFVRVAYGHQNKHDIYSNQITATQIEPAAEAAFNGTGQDLLNLLSTDFFFDLDGGGGVDTNFANADLVLDDNRLHDFDGKYMLLNEKGFTDPISTQPSFILDPIGSLFGTPIVGFKNGLLGSVNTTLLQQDDGGGLKTLIQTQDPANNLHFLQVTQGGVFIAANNGVDQNSIIVDKTDGIGLKVEQGNLTVDIPSADTVGKALVLVNTATKETEFTDISSLVNNTIFAEQDATTTSAGALFVTRHTFNGNLDVGSYEISFFTYMGAGGAFAELRNGILINGVVEYDRGFSTFFVVEQAYPNTFILNVTTAGVFDIQAQFRRVTAGVTVDCNFSNLIIKKIA